MNILIGKTEEEIAREFAENAPITEEIASKVLKVVNKGLCLGLGQAVPGAMCVEAAVCYAYGLPHSDKPPCVDEDLINFKIKLNDTSGWASDKSRAKGLRRIAIAQLGTNKKFNSDKFMEKVNNILCKKYLSALNIVLADRIKKQVDEKLKYCLSMNNKGIDIFLGDEFELNPYDTFDINVYDIRTTLELYIEKLIESLPKKKLKGLSNRILTEFAEDCVQILISMKTEGSKFLYLTE